MRFYAAFLLPYLPPSKGEIGSMKNKKRINQRFLTKRSGKRAIFRGAVNKAQPAIVY
jgi:hypothetical protein